MTRVFFSGTGSHVPPSARPLIAFSFLAALGATLVGCGDFKVEEASGTAEEVADASPNAVLKELGLTLNRVRIYKGLNPTSGPSYVGTRDFFHFDLWVTPSEEKVPRLEQSGLRYVVDDAGNLNVPESRPGQLEQSGRVVFDAKGKSSLETWTRDAKTALMRYTPALHVYETSVSDSSGVTKTTKVQKKVSELDKTQTTRFGRLDLNDAVAIATDSRIVPAAGMKGRLGCEVTTVKNGTSGSVKTVAYTFSDVELGDVLLDADNTASTGTVDTFGDRTLYVARTARWHVVGLNVNERKIRLLRRQTRAFYMSRSLPAKKDSTKFLASGFELALRACNKAAKTTDATAVNTTWRLVTFAESTGATPTAFKTVGSLSDIPHCSEWANAADPAKEFSTLAGTATGCAVFKAKLASLSSQWDGVKYSDDTPASVNSDGDFEETSAVVEASY
ncbi:MAG: hypothetical protein IOD12_08625 [Silvanigrellales bacterium]|nr:hypothetical protein [Silvanigrellales bacterium]